MKVNIDIDEKYDKTSITIQTNEWTEELDELLKIIKGRQAQRLFGIDHEQTVILAPDDIDYIYAENRKVFAALKNKKHIEIKKKLYELEELLIPYSFIRFSKSVIGNLKQIQRFELSFNGNLCVYFHSGNKEYITRRYVSSVKEKLQGGQAHD